MANVLIIGGGFAGLIAAERLSASLDSTHQITLASPNKKFTFYPALVELAFGECDVSDITFDLSEKLAALGVRYVKGEVLGINARRRRARVTGDDFDGELVFDFVIFAMGRRLATEKVGGFFEHSHHLLGTNAAIKFGNAVNKFTEGNIVLGSCPGGRLPVPPCEAAFVLANKFEREIAEGIINIKVIFPESLSKAFGGADLHKELESAFAKRKINVLYDVPISEISEIEVISAEKHRIAHDLLMLIPPFRGQAILDDLGITDENDFIKVNDQMQVNGMENAYAAGDLVAFSGPKFAHMAVRQAEVAAANLASELSGKDPKAHYDHEIAAIIDAGGADSIYLHYGIWDESLYRIRKGAFWSWAKGTHDAIWRARHR